MTSDELSYLVMVVAKGQQLAGEIVVLLETIAWLEDKEKLEVCVNRGGTSARHFLKIGEDVEAMDGLRAVVLDWYRNKLTYTMVALDGLKS